MHSDVEVVEGATAQLPGSEGGGLPAYCGPRPCASRSPETHTHWLRESGAEMNEK